ncbi:beta-ketoacyl-ACP reductase [Reticulibacter mediterranei]|uniref:Beta-ketoacyl-ACP reductase n=1 Tax=Reticulibacter mediterranei TaxID=2778369 RepID=A0A8J3N5U9_9CHLR|nr:SDR family oxidoreductase [Reticulibacter mediterranei]GHO99474.1 beta-ketoacyl-ACP reductase [Reticulibacter mediterranei]
MSNQHIILKDQTLQGRVALITGASRGIGAATARLFATHGALVGVNYHRSEQEAFQIVREIEAAGGKALAVQASADDPLQLVAMVKRVEEELGPIHTLVLNAAPTKRFAFAPFIDFDWGVFQDMVLGELAGIYFPAQVVAPLMIQRKQGSIIAVSSPLSRMGWPGTLAHATGKAGVDAMARTLAVELGPHGIRVNTIAPGAVKTDSNPMPKEAEEMNIRTTPLGRVTQAEDVAGAIYLLALDEAGFISGSYTAASGGQFLE